MPSVNTVATHKFVIVLNEKSPIGKLLSATGQLAGRTIWPCRGIISINQKILDF